MKAEQAIDFVKKHGVVLESAAGPVPSLAEEVTGERPRGSWWSHPKGREIFALTRSVRDCDDVLVCRAIGGKVTYVHRRLWPALVRAAEHFAPERLAKVREVHTGTGHHATEETPFPDWVPEEVAAEARRLSIEEALPSLGAWAYD